MQTRGPWQSEMQADAHDESGAGAQHIDMRTRGSKLELSMAVMPKSK